MPRKKKVSIPSHPDFPEKWAQHLTDTFVSRAEAMEKDEMDTYVVECEMTIDATQKDVADDVKIQDLKEQLKYLREGYRDVLSKSQAEIKFLLYLMNCRGYNVKIHDGKLADDSEDE
jgi:hypothetical protein